MDFPSRSTLEDRSKLRQIKLLIANYSKIRIVEPPQDCIATAVEGNWNAEE